MDQRCHHRSLQLASWSVELICPQAVGIQLPGTRHRMLEIFLQKKEHQHQLRVSTSNNFFIN